MHDDNISATLTESSRKAKMLIYILSDVLLRQVLQQVFRLLKSPKESIEAATYKVASQCSEAKLQYKISEIKA